MPERKLDIHVKSTGSNISTSVKSVKHTHTWGQLILLTTILSHKSCINTSREVLEKTLFAINAS